MASLSTGGGSGRSIFPKGPSFTLENFSNKDFIVRDFIEDLAESAIPINRRSGPAQHAFDPKPLIRTFESSVPQPVSLGNANRLKTLYHSLEVFQRSWANEKLSY
jgi:hypothetical protein